MGVQAPLLTYFGEPKQTNAIQLALGNEQAKIQLTGLIGSSFALTVSAVVRTSNNPHLFIFRDKFMNIAKKSNVKYERYIQNKSKNTNKKYKKHKSNNINY